MNSLAFVTCVIVAFCVLYSSATEVPIVVEASPTGYQGPLALPVVLPSGHLADTREVAAERSRHIAAMVKAHATAAPYHNSGPYASVYNTPVYPVRAYYGPVANPVVLSSGYLADTRDVAAAKGAHYAALAHAATHPAAHDGDNGVYRGPRYSGVYTEGAAPPHQPYHGPLATPVILENGFLADTHEVASAKGAHLSALAQAKATASPEQPPVVVAPQ